MSGLIRAAIVAAFALSLFPVTASAQVTLPFTEGFEGTSGETYTTATIGLTGAPEWDYSNTDASGRLRTSAFPNSGTAAATLDRDPSGAVQTNYLTLTLDMSNYAVANDGVILDFFINNHGEEAHPNDRVWVRGSATDTYVELGNLSTLDGSPGVWTAVVDLNVSSALAAASQSFTSTFQVRFGQEDTHPAASLNSTDGYSFDDIELRLLPPNDVTALAIVSPVPGECGLTASMIEVQIENVGGATQTNIPIDVTVSGDVTATVSGTLAGPLASGAVDTAVIGPVDLFSATTIDVTATAMLVGDSDTSNDAVTSAGIVIAPTEIAVAAVPTICPLSTATLTAPTEAGVTYEWWDASTAGNSLGTGDTYTTGPLSAAPATQSFWVDRVATSGSVGPVDNTFGGGANYTFLPDGLVFDATAAFTLTSVTVYPSGPGDVVVNLLDSADNTLATATVPVTTTGATVIPLGFGVPIGTGHKLNAVGTTTGGLYRNNNSAAYPYTSAGGEVSITGAINALTGYYYFFYDWQIVVGGCGDERTEVVVTVDAAVCTADLAVTVTGPEPAVAGAEETWTLMVENLGPDTATGITLDDPTPAGLTFVSATGDCIGGFPCTLTDMAPFTTTAVDVVLLVPADWDPTVTVVNTATVSATEPDGDATNDSHSLESTVVQQADLQIAVTDDPDPAWAGGVLTYTATITNAGPSDASDVVITMGITEGLDDVVVTAGCAEDPDGLPTCTVGTVAAGGDAVVTYAVGLDPAELPGTIEATFAVASSAEETAPGDESWTEPTNIDVASDLAVTLADDADPVQPEDPVVFIVEVTNNGPSVATGVVAEITLADGAGLTAVPEGCTDDFGLVCQWESMAPEEVKTVEVETTATAAEGTMTTSVSVSHDGTEAAEGDEDATEDTLVARVADLVLTASLDPGAVTAGGSATVSASIDNLGPADVDDATLTLALPDGVTLPDDSGCSDDGNGDVTCEVGEVGSGATAELEVAIDVDGEAGTVTIEVAIAASPADPDEADNVVILELVIEAAGDDDDDDDDRGGRGGAGTVGCAGCGGSVAAADGSSWSLAWLLLGVVALRRRRG